MTFPPGAMPTIPTDPVKGVMNWDVPLNSKLDGISSAVTQAWQNAVDTATVLGQRAITPVVNSGTEIANPVDGQLCYITSTRVYQRYNGTNSTWVAFLTAGANGSYINSYTGAWTAQAYATGAIVTYLGSSWISTGAVSSTQIPGIDPAWAVIAAAGATGTPGVNILNGTSNPTSGQGNNGDLFYNTTTSTMFGPKASGAWPGSGTSLVGPTGAAGQGVATGGTAGQYLKKNSSTNYDDAWGAIVDADINSLNSVTNKALDANVVHLAGAETITGAKTFSTAPTVPNNAFPEAAITNLTGDLAARLLLAGGTMTGAISYSGAANSTIGSQSQVTGDTNQRFTRRLDGQMAWGSGAASTDTDLRRSGAGVLATDNSLAALQGLQVGAVSPSLGGGVGVLGITNAATAPTSNPSGGGVFYAASGAPTWRDPNGNVWNLTPPNRNYPSDQNLIGWTFEPQFANGTASALTAGVMLLARVLLKTGATITNIIVNVTTAAVGNTNTYVGFFDFTGTRQGLSADQSTAFQSTGTKTIALTTPYVAAQGNYWIAVLVGAASTLPQLSASTASAVPASLANLGLTASTARWATNGSSLTAIPSTLTPASNTLSNATIFAAVS